jgi:hypothetical protein
MTQRTQVTLESSDHRKARRRAAELGISLAEYVRRLIRRDLADDRPRGDVTSLFALGKSAGSDVRRHKDAYIGQAMAAERK